MLKLTEMLHALYGYKLQQPVRMRRIYYSKYKYLKPDVPILYKL